MGVWLGSQQLGGLLFHTEAAGGSSVWTLLVCFGASFFLGEGSSQPTTWLIFGLCQVNLLLCWNVSTMEDVGAPLDTQVL